MPNRTADPLHPLYEGRPDRYQSEALEHHWRETGLIQNTWSWVTTTCGQMCLDADHMVINTPKRLGYRQGQCIYCGRSAATEDHLLPRAWSGKSSRGYVVTVPSCGTCNSTLGDVMAWSINERRMICHHRLRRKYRRVLLNVEYGETDLSELGDTLRAEVEAGMRDKAEVERMLAWPDHDPAYDARACEKAGIEDAYQAGILSNHEQAVRQAREAVGFFEAEEEGVKAPVSAIGFRSHGQIGTYRLGCRCDKCSDAHRDFKARSKKRKKPKIYEG